MENQRENFRIDYLVNDHPTFKYLGHKFAIINVSTTGLLFQYGKNLVLPEPNDHLEGLLYFQDGTTVETAGIVIRTSKKKRQVAIQFHQELPPALIMEQHRKWINRHN